MNTRRLAAALFLAALLATGCAHARREAGAVRPRRAEWVRTELYFGAPPQEDWERFLLESVTPKFPDGLSVFDVSGQWRAKDGVVHKVPTKVLMILHPPDEESGERIEGIRREFLRRWRHESVLRVDAPASVSF
jgi:Protein of unknown function (DUF3574)